MEFTRGIEKRAEPIAHDLEASCGLRPGNTRPRLLAAIKKDLDAGAAGSRGRANGLGAASIEGGKDALDMLAGAEAIDAVIDAAAGIGVLVEVADLHLVTRSAPSSDTKTPEHRVLRLQRLELGDLGAPPPLPQRDFVGVAGTPPQRLRSVKDGARPSAFLGRGHARLTWPGESDETSAVCGLVLRISEHGPELGSGKKPEQSGSCRSSDCFHRFYSHRPADTLPARSARQGALVKGAVRHKSWRRAKAPVATATHARGAISFASNPAPALRCVTAITAAARCPATMPNG